MGWAPTSLLPPQVAAPVAVCLQLILLLLLQVIMLGQVVAQQLQLVVEITLGAVLEETKHQ